MENTNSKQFFYFLLCLSPMILVLFMPISGDLSIYLSGARTTIEGKLLYKDFIDLKQPLFYYLYVPIELIAHGNDVLVRFFEMMIQVLAMGLLYKLLQRINQNLLLAQLSVFYYSLSYSVLGYTLLFHGESWINLIVISLFYVTLNDEIKFKSLIQGFLIGLMISIKITLGVVLISFIFWELWNGIVNNRQFIKQMIIISLIAFIVFCIPFLLLINTDVRINYQYVASYLKSYSNLPQLSATSIKMILKNISIIFGDNYSLVLTLLVFTGILNSLNSFRKYLQLEKKFFLMFSFTCLFLFISVVVERKISGFHFLRLYPFLSFFAAYGTVYLISIIKNLGIQSKFKKSFFILVITVLVLLFSPITRFLNLIPTVIYKLTNEQKYDMVYTNTDDNIHLRAIYKKINKKFDSVENKRIIVSSIGGNLINYNMKKNVTSKFTQSLFYFSTYSPDFWLNEFVEEVRTADYLVIQTNDNHPILTNHNFSSFEMFNKNKVLKQLLDSQFVLDEIILPFNIYKRIN